MQELLENPLVVDEKTSFEDIFQPYDMEEFIQAKLKDSKCTKNEDNSYDCEGDMDLSGLGLKEIPVRFREVKGDFHCARNELTSLEGAPEIVEGVFNCMHNVLTTLKGCPKYVGRGFYCSYNKLTTLEGAPRVVGGGFHCDFNDLTSLEGVPRVVGGGFYCSDNKLSEEELKKTVDRDYLN